MIKKAAIFAGLPALWLISAAWTAEGQHIPKLSFSESHEAGPQVAGSENPITTQAKVVVKDMQGSEIKLKPGETIAFMFMEAIADLESGCRRQLSRACPLEELVKGAKSPEGSIGKLKFDPATDLNYKYTIIVSGKDWEARAIPRHEGFGGVFYDGSTTIPHSYYNSNGPATPDNTRLGEIGIAGDSFKTQ